ncbi:MAG: hypothetical protein QMD01_05195 [Thermodesulfovibrionales bacterium]|nr:hypothetical protein [Thermodesulfovibrionales bacterium]
MTKKEYVERNIGVTFDFVKHIIDHPEVIDTIPDGAELDFIDKDMPFKTKTSLKRKKIKRYKVQHTFESVKA